MEWILINIKQHIFIVNIPLHWDDMVSLIARPIPRPVHVWSCTSCIIMHHNAATSHLTNEIIVFKWKLWCRWLHYRGAFLNIKMISYLYRNSHHKGNIISWLCYLYNGSLHSWKDGLHIEAGLLTWTDLINFFWLITKKILKLCITGLLEGNPPVTQESPHKEPLFMIMSSNENIFCVTGHLCGEFTGSRSIPHTKASDAELWCLLWSAPE